MSRILFAKFGEDPSLMKSAKVQYFLDRGDYVRPLIAKGKTQKDYESIFSSYDHVFIYNGSRQESEGMTEAADAIGIPKTYWEGGILPARAHQFIDRKGVLGASSFCEDVSWVTQKHIDNLFSWKKTYIQEMGLSEEETKWKRGDYILCPMQCFWDANFNPELGWSPFTGKNAMVEFICHIQDKHPDEKLVFRCHPADVPNIDKYRPYVRRGNELMGGKWHNDPGKYEPELILQMVNAKKVIGTNSTCLLQSILFGVPTEALGWGYVQAAGSGYENQIKMVAAVRHRTFRWKDYARCYRIMEEIHPPGTRGWD